MLWHSLLRATAYRNGSITGAPGPEGGIGASMATVVKALAPCFYFRYFQTFCVADAIFSYLAGSLERCFLFQAWLIEGPMWAIQQERCLSRRAYIQTRAKNSSDFLISVWHWSFPSMSWHMLFVLHSSCSLCPLRNNRGTVVKWQCRMQAVKMRSSLCRLLSSLVAWNKYQIRHRYVYFIISGSDFRIFGSNTFRFF